jgi:hypothetical protein
MPHRTVASHHEQLQTAVRIAGQHRHAGQELAAAGGPQRGPARPAASRRALPAVPDFLVASCKRRWGDEFQTAVGVSAEREGPEESTGRLAKRMPSRPAVVGGSLPAMPHRPLVAHIVVGWDRDLQAPVGVLREHQQRHRALRVRLAERVPSRPAVVGGGLPAMPHSLVAADDGDLKTPVSIAADGGPGGPPAGSAERMPSRPGTVWGGLPGVPHLTPESRWIICRGYQFQATVLVRSQSDLSYLRHGPQSPTPPLPAPSRIGDQASHIPVVGR